MGINIADGNLQDSYCVCCGILMLDPNLITMLFNIDVIRLSFVVTSNLLDIAIKLILCFLGKSLEY
jgi:hypothetical protein